MNSKIFYSNYLKSQKFFFNIVKTKCKIKELIGNIKKYCITLESSHRARYSSSVEDRNINHAMYIHAHAHIATIIDSTFSCSTKGNKIRTVLIGKFRGKLYKESTL